MHHWLANEHQKAASRQGSAISPDTKQSCTADHVGALFEKLHFLLQVLLFVGPNARVQGCLVIETISSAITASVERTQQLRHETSQMGHPSQGQHPAASSSAPDDFMGRSRNCPAMPAEDTPSHVGALVPFQNMEASAACCHDNVGSASSSRRPAGQPAAVAPAAAPQSSCMTAAASRRLAAGFWKQSSDPEGVGEDDAPPDACAAAAAALPSAGVAGPEMPGHSSCRTPCSHSDQQQHHQHQQQRQQPGLGGQASMHHPADTSWNLLAPSSVAPEQHQQRQAESSHDSQAGLLSEGMLRQASATHADRGSGSASPGALADATNACTLATADDQQPVLGSSGTSRCRGEPKPDHNSLAAIPSSTAHHQSSIKHFISGQNKQTGAAGGGSVGLHRQQTVLQAGGKENRAGKPSPLQRWLSTGSLRKVLLPSPQPQSLSEKLASNCVGILHHATGHFYDACMQSTRSGIDMRAAVMSIKACQECMSRTLQY